MSVRASSRAHPGAALRLDSLVEKPRFGPRGIEAVKHTLEGAS